MCDLQWEPPVKIRGRATFNRPFKWNKRRPPAMPDRERCYAAGLVAGLRGEPTFEACRELSPAESMAVAHGYSVGFRRREAADG